MEFPVPEPVQPVGNCQIKLEPSLMDVTDKVIGTPTQAGAEYPLMALGVPNDPKLPIMVFVPCGLIQPLLFAETVTVMEATLFGCVV